MAKAGAKRISATELERVLAMVHEFCGVPVGAEIPRGPRTELAKALGVSQPAVSNWILKKSGVAESTARALAVKLGKPEEIWRDGYKSKQLEPAAVRLGRECAVLGLDDTLTRHLLAVVNGGEGMGDERSPLPEPLRRAAIAVVHLLGFSLEQVTLEAAALHRETVSKQGAAVAKRLDAEQWYPGLAKRLSGKKAGSGTRPRVSLVPEGER